MRGMHAPPWLVDIDDLRQQTTFVRSIPYDPCSQSYGGGINVVNGRQAEKNGMTIPTLMLDTGPHRC